MINILYNNKRLFCLFKADIKMANNIEYLRSNTRKIYESQSLNELNQNINNDNFSYIYSINLYNNNLNNINKDIILRPELYTSNKDNIVILVDLLSKNIILEEDFITILGSLCDNNVTNLILVLENLYNNNLNNPISTIKSKYNDKLQAINASNNELLYINYLLNNKKVESTSINLKDNNLLLTIKLLLISDIDCLTENNNLIKEHMVNNVSTINNYDLYEILVIIDYLYLSKISDNKIFNCIENRLYDIINNHSFNDSDLPIIIKNILLVKDNISPGFYEFVSNYYTDVIDNLDSDSILEIARELQSIYRLSETVYNKIITNINAFDLSNINNIISVLDIIEKRNTKNKNNELISLLSKKIQELDVSVEALEEHNKLSLLFSIYSLNLVNNNGLISKLNGIIINNTNNKLFFYNKVNNIWNNLRDESEIDNFNNHFSNIIKINADDNGFNNLEKIWINNIFDKINFNLIN